MCNYITESAAWGDLGDGFYRNPILPADYSDPDIIRVGDDYYLITSTFVMSPGITLLHSRDLVNWEIIGGTVRDITQISPRHSYTEMNTYGRGIWAPAISYNERQKRFYIHFCDPDHGLYMIYTDDIHGQWSDVHEMLLPDGTGFGAGWDDCAVLWDDDGAYFAAVNFADNYKDYIFKLSCDGYHLLDRGVVVHQSGDGLYPKEERNPEALKLFRRDGMYYIFHNGVVGGKRKAFVMKSANIYGKYEHMPFPIVEGYREPNQGNIVDIPADDGTVKWYFLTHHGLTAEDGRPLSLIPVTWNKDGWPVAGELTQEAIEKPVKQSMKVYPQTSDNFEGETLGAQWMWNYQPRDDFWSLTERPGFLRLYAFKPLTEGALNKAGNSLLQRMYRSDSTVTIKMDISHMTDGQFAGLLYMMGARAAGIGVCRRDGVSCLRFKCDSEDLEGCAIPRTVHNIYLKAEWQTDMLIRSSYSFDGVTYIPFGSEYQVRGSNYRGGHIGLFCYSDISESGYVDISFFRYDLQHK